MQFFETVKIDFEVFLGVKGTQLSLESPKIVSEMRMGDNRLVLKDATAGPICSILILADRATSDSTRIVLNESLAAEIYRLKITMLQKHATFPRDPVLTLRGQSVFVSSMFDVSPKTIRDIWNRRTWQRATQAFWAFEGSSFQPPCQRPKQEKLSGVRKRFHYSFQFFASPKSEKFC
jgi:hypothetical protein